MKLPRQGLAHVFSATCMSEICDWSEVLASSKSRGEKGYEINLRTCLACHEIVSIKVFVHSLS